MPFITYLPRYCISVGWPSGSPRAFWGVRTHWAYKEVCGSSQEQLSTSICPLQWEKGIGNFVTDSAQVNKFVVFMTSVTFLSYNLGKFYLLVLLYCNKDTYALWFLFLFFICIIMSCHWGSSYSSWGPHTTKT